jgi:hypothetical protein
LIHHFLYCFAYAARIAARAISQIILVDIQSRLLSDEKRYQVFVQLENVALETQSRESCSTAIEDACTKHLSVQEPHSVVVE